MLLIGDEVASVEGQIVTVFGVIAGGVMSYLFTSLADRTRWRRTQDTKLDELRIEAYASYAQAVKAVFSMAGRIAAARGLNITMRPIEPEVGLPELDKLAVEREGKWEHVLLIGDPMVVSAARTWHQSIWHLEWYARDKIPNSSPQTYEKAVLESGLARDRFYEAARSSLRLSGRLPGAPWPPPWMPDASPSAGAASATSNGCE